MRLFFAIIIIALSSAPGFAQVAEFDIDKAVIKFPKTHEGEVLHHTFVVENTGNAPLIISKYEVACSCTQLTYPDYPIKPGESAELKLTFDTKGKYYFQDRTILVHTNTRNGIHKLRMKVNVIPKEQ
jgi:hypothetical protein